MRKPSILAVLMCLVVAKPIAATATELAAYPLEAKCLSDNIEDRRECIGYIEWLLDYNLDSEPAEARTQAEADGAREAARHLDRGIIRNGHISCFLDELLTLSTVAVHGYREILETMDWLESTEGQVQTAPYPILADAANDLAERIGPAVAAIRSFRLNGNLPWSCRLNPFLWFD